MSSKSSKQTKSKQPKPAKSSGLAGERKNARGRANTPLSKGAAETVLLKKLIAAKGPAKKEGCFIPSSNLASAGTLVWDRMFALSAAVMYQLNDELSTIFYENRILPREILNYLVRCFVWYQHCCGNVSPMPDLNCSDFVVPAWVGVIFQNHAPFVFGDSKYARRLTNVSEAAIAGQGALLGIIGDWAYPKIYYVPIEADPYEGEPSFAQSPAAALGTLGVTQAGYISTLFGSLAQKVLIRDLPLTCGKSNLYLNSGYGSLHKSTNTSAGFILTTTDSVYCGNQVSTINPQGALPWFSFVAGSAWSPTASHNTMLRHRGVHPDRSVIVGAQINLPYLSLMAADYLIVNSVPDVDFWKTWKNLYIEFLAWYCAQAPLISKGGASPGPWLKSPLHSQARVTPQISTLQPLGWYVVNETPVLVSANPRGLALLELLTGEVSFEDYSGVNGGPGNFYLDGTVDLTQAYDLPTPAAGRQWNLFPMGRWDDVCAFTSELPLTRYKFLNPHLHKCYCFAKLEKINDTRTVGPVTVNYRALQDLNCNSQMTATTCCWMNSGTMLHTFNDMDTIFKLVSFSYENRVRLMSEAVTLNEAAQVAVGQSRNVSASFTAVVKDQISGGHKMVETFPMKSFKKMVKEYVANSPDVPDTAPSWESLANAASGSLPLNVTLATFAAAAVHYGPRVYRAWNQIRAAVDVLNH